VGQSGPHKCLSFVPDALPTRLFLGKFRPVLDPKHRITIPKNWRDGATERFYLIPSVDRLHIDVLPPAEFQKTYEALLAGNEFSKSERRSFQRVHFSEVQPCDTDGQGRIVLPEEFCRVGDLHGELLLLGTFSSFEIWNPARWETVRPQELDTANRVGAAQGL
jgi:division/cell wall cluster transcriptional repressor MraZ